MTIQYNEFYQAKFINTKEYCGLKYNKLYTIKIEENRPYGLYLSVIDEDGFDERIAYSNIKSIEKVWKINV